MDSTHQLQQRTQDNGFQVISITFIGVAKNDNDNGVIILIFSKESL